MEPRLWSSEWGNRIHSLNGGGPFEYLLVALFAFTSIRLQSHLNCSANFFPAVVKDSSVEAPGGLVKSRSTTNSWWGYNGRVDDRVRRSLIDIEINILNNDLSASSPKLNFLNFEIGL